MKLLRNPIVVGGLAILAGFLVIRSLAPMWQRGRPARQTATKPAPEPAHSTSSGHAPAHSTSSGHAPTTAHSGAPASAPATNTPPATPEPKMELSQVGWNTNASARRDPFQAINSGSTNRLYPPAWQLLNLTAVWRQTGGKLAVINRKVLAEGDTVTADLKGTPAAGLQNQLQFTVEKIEDDLVWVVGPSGLEPLEFKPPLQGQTKPAADSATQPKSATAMR